MNTDQTSCNNIASHNVLLPPIFLNTLPKSGSVFMLKSLENILGIKYLNVSPGYFPLDLINRAAIEELAAGNAITQSHVTAHPVNIGQINFYLKNFWLHVRDPRSAILSWTHHIDKFSEQPGPLSVQNPPLPSEYFKLAFEDKLTWQIDNYLPSFISWIMEWLEVIDSKQLKTRILVTDYSEFHDNQEAFFKKVLDFYNISLNNDTENIADVMNNDKAQNSPTNETINRWKNVEKITENNFRSGKLDEWQEAFNKNNIKKANDLIPQALFRRFNWPVNNMYEIKENFLKSSLQTLRRKFG